MISITERTENIESPRASEFLLKPKAAEALETSPFTEQSTMFNTNAAPSDDG